MRRGFIHFFILIIVALVATIFYISRKIDKPIFLIPAPTAYQFPYKNRVIPKARSYRIAIVGDSIVGSLGLNANVLRLNLIEYYPDNEFVTYNYGYSATNILSLPERLNSEILKGGFDLLILESFGYNPLSEFSLSEGLQKQTEILEQSVQLILTKKLNAALAFMTPIAFDTKNFAKGTYDLSPEQRKLWIEERIAYIENHKKFADQKGIPVIDVYTASLKPNGEVDRSFISDDFIHPSQRGIELISREIADYIFENKIFPE